MRSQFAVLIPALMLALTPVAVLSGSRKPAELVDINRASIQELLTVPGMTQSWAARIVRFRPYRSKLDLVEQGVVPQEVYQRIRDGVVAHRMPEDEATSGKRP
jgi:DNA uptake protein ComE-like DNA-binding protein